MSEIQHKPKLLNAVTRRFIAPKITGEIGCSSSFSFRLRDTPIVLSCVCRFPANWLDLHLPRSSVGKSWAREAWYAFEGSGKMRDVASQLARNVGQRVSFFHKLHMRLKTLGFLWSDRSYFHFEFALKRSYREVEQSVAASSSERSCSSWNGVAHKRCFAKLVCHSTIAGLLLAKRLAVRRTGTKISGQDLACRAKWSINSCSRLESSVFYDVCVMPL